MNAPHEAFPLPEGCDEGYVVANGVRLHGFPKFWYCWCS